MTLRPARRGEAEALAHLHVEAWRDAHAAFAPAAATKALTAERRLPTWQRTLADPVQHVLVAEHVGALAGLVCFGPASQSELGTQAEIKHLYVAAVARQQGVGKSLLQAALTQIATLGFTNATLAVVQDNTAARAFYKTCGGQEVGTFTDVGPLWKSTNIIVEWKIACPPPLSIINTQKSHQQAPRPPRGAGAISPSKPPSTRRM